MQKPTVMNFVANIRQLQQADDLKTTLGEAAKLACFACLAIGQTFRVHIDAHNRVRLLRVDVWTRDEKNALALPAHRLARRRILDVRAAANWRRSTLWRFRAHLCACGGGIVR